MIRSTLLAAKALSVYSRGKEFLYDHTMSDKVAPFKKDADMWLNIKVNS